MREALLYLPLALGLGSLFVFSALIIGWISVRFSAPTTVRTLAVVGLLGHFTVGALLHFGGVASDAQAYHSDALLLSDFWIGSGHISPSLSDGKLGWVWLLAIAYSLVGGYEVLGIAINASLLALIPIQMFVITRSLFDYQVAIRAAFLAWAIPASWLWGSLPLREASISVLMLLSLHFLLSTARGGGTGSWIGLFGSLALLIAFRGSMAIVLTIAAVAGLLMVRRQHGWLPKSKLAMIPLALLLALVGQVAISEGGSDLSVDRVSAIQSSQSRSASSAFDVTQRPTSIVDVLTGLPVALSRVLVGPFPWELSAVPLPLLADVLYWWVVLGLAVVGFRWVSTRFNTTLLLLVPLAGLLLALAVYSGNYGTMIRIRGTGTVYLIPLAAMALTFWSKRPRKRWAASSL